jgi:hypothetical protein
MKGGEMKKLLFFTGLVLLLGISLTTAMTAAQERGRIANISALKGTAEVKTANGVWSPAKEGTVLNQNDSIRTGKGSLAILNLDGNGQTATLEVKEKTELQLTEMLANQQKGTQKTLLDLSLGNILIKAKKLHSDKSSFEIRTPTSVVAVRGTTFAVTVEAIE